MPELRGKNWTNERLLERPNVARWQSLALYNTQIDDDGLLTLCQTATRLQEIHIASVLISDRSMESLCRLPRLRSLLLSDVPRVTDKGVRHVAQAKELRELYLEGTRAGDDSMKAIAGLPHVWSLNLRGTSVTDRGLSVLTSLQSLRILTLDQTPISGSGLSEINFQERFSLYLNNCPITDEGIEPFLLRTRSPAILSLCSTRITDLSLPAIAMNRGLEDLRLNFTSVTDRGLESLLGHPNLSMLYVEGTQVTKRMTSRIKRESPIKDLIIYS